MPILEYERGNERTRLRRREILRWVFSFIALVVLVTATDFIFRLSWGAWKLHRFEQTTAQQIQQFNEATKESKMLGKTPDEVISLLGHPADDSRTLDNFHDTKDAFFMIYEGPLLHFGVPDRPTCTITFTNDKVTTVDHSSGEE
ncbi:MAG TPA: hypothetical protein VHS31_11700 [Tepidisphaeraceae bacterium]|jgi:hypothetical protein|nr:hypothetical protein [Tepidisphaeraceae bacterium]